MIFHIWSDNTVCTADELPRMDHKGPHYLTVEMPDEDRHAVPTYGQVIKARMRELEFTPRHTSTEILDRVLLADDRKGAVYLAGPMSGYEEHNFPAFNAAAADLRSQGYFVINPADHGVVPGAEWADYLRHDIAKLAACESIALLPGWIRSEGARLEVVIAQSLGMGFIYTEGAEQL